MYYDTPPSIWRLSELLTWSDFEFVDSSEATDVEMYCSLMGAYDICTLFRGVVPIVHGPLSCVSSYYPTRVATRLRDKLKPLPLSSCMNEHDVIFGATEKLRTVIKEADQLYRPRLIVILTTCVSEMIAEDMEALATGMRGQIGADLLVMNIGGITCKGFREGADYAFKRLMDHVKEKNPNPPKKPNSVNLFLRRTHGKLSDDRDVREMKRMLGVNGIEINTVVRIGTSYDELLNIPQAQANVSLCFTYGKEVMRHLSEIFGQPYSRAHHPIGLSWTKKWVGDVTRILGLQDVFASSPEVRAAEADLESLKAFLASKMKFNHMYIWQPGPKGLAFAGLAYDLGLQPRILALTYHLLKVNREVILDLLHEGHDPEVVVRGSQKLWVDIEKTHGFFERPVLFMPKKAWNGNFPTIDIDLIRHSAVGLTGFADIARALRTRYTEEPKKNFSVFDRYIHRKFETVQFEKTLPSVAK